MISKEDIDSILSGEQKWAIGVKGFLPSSRSCDDYPFATLDFIGRNRPYSEEGELVASKIIEKVSEGVDLVKELPIQTESPSLEVLQAIKTATLFPQLNDPLQNIWADLATNLPVIKTDEGLSFDYSWCNLGAFVINQQFQSGNDKPLLQAMENNILANFRFKFLAMGKDERFIDHLTNCLDSVTRVVPKERETLLYFKVGSSPRGTLVDSLASCFMGETFRRFFPEEMREVSSKYAHLSTFSLQ